MEAYDGSTQRIHICAAEENTDLPIMQALIHEGIHAYDDVYTGFSSGRSTIHSLAKTEEQQSYANAKNVLATTADMLDRTGIFKGSYLRPKDYEQAQKDIKIPNNEKQTSLFRPWSNMYPGDTPLTTEKGGVAGIFVVEVMSFHTELLYDVLNKSKYNDIYTDEDIKRDYKEVLTTRATALLDGGYELSTIEDSLELTRKAVQTVHEKLGAKALEPEIEVQQQIAITKENNSFAPLLMIDEAINEVKNDPTWKTLSIQEQKNRRKDDDINRNDDPDKSKSRKNPGNSRANNTQNNSHTSNAKNNTQNKGSNQNTGKGAKGKKASEMSIPEQRLSKVQAKQQRKQEESMQRLYAQIPNPQDQKTDVIEIEKESTINPIKRPYNEFDQEQAVRMGQEHQGQKYFVHEEIKNGWNPALAYYTKTAIKQNIEKTSIPNGLGGHDIDKSWSKY